MNFILIVLCGILMGAFNFAFFIFGYYVRSRKPDDGVVATKDNREFIEEMMRWRNYHG